MLSKSLKEGKKEYWVRNEGDILYTDKLQKCSEEDVEKWFKENNQ